MDDMLNWSQLEQAKYIRGFGDGEGSVIFGWSYKKKNGKKYPQRNRSIKFSNTNKLILTAIKKMLEKMGISSHIYVDTKAGVRRSTIDSWSLVICKKEDFKRFNELIGFSDLKKSEKLSQVISSYK
jgi:intein-encoded DNA endonuclease-like protein